MGYTSFDFSPMAAASVVQLVVVVVVVQELNIRLPSLSILATRI